MRPWYKYIFEHGKTGKVFLPMDMLYEYQSKAMEYDKNLYYASKKIFWNTYFQGRYSAWDVFLRACLSKNDQIFSIASGRCINELKLIEDGYKISCSDMEKPQFLEKSIELFGEYTYTKFNVLTEKFHEKYDAIICLGLICLLNNDELDIVFENIKNGLKPKGKLILESPGQDDIVTFIFHDLYLKFEYNFIYLFRRLFGKKYRLIKSFHAYKRTNQEIIDLAKKHNLFIKSRESCDFLNEFQRSIFISKLFLYFPRIENVFSILGKWMPYSRMFEFIKQ